MTRLSIDLTEQQHQSIKAMAALQGKSLKAYAVERLLPLKDDEQQVMAELKALLAPRLDPGLRGDVSKQSVSDIVEDVLQNEGSGA